MATNERPRPKAPPCPKCGTEAKPATRVVAWTCPECGALFRAKAKAKTETTP